MFFSKKKLAIMILSVIAVAYSLPVFAQKSYCWTKDSCTKANGIYAETAESKGDCVQSPIKYNFCFPKETPVNLQVPIGMLNQASSLTQYIPAVYNYLVSIVSIVAIVMIMVGGLRYLTAGGNPSAITSAKETILGAVIGLFLTLGSYVILQTINPALVTLSLPPVKMVAPQSLAQWCPDTGEFQGKFKCGTKYTAQSDPKPPINSGYCLGSACDKQGDIEMGCGKPSYDATESKCMNLVALKACDRIKKLGDECPNLSVFNPASNVECHAHGILGFTESSLSNSKISVKTTENYEEALSSGLDIVALSEKGIEIKIYTYGLTIDNVSSGRIFKISLCEGGWVSCNGPEKVNIDDLCKQLQKLPSTSKIFNFL